MTGQTLSHYRILDKLGEGGMGVVYKAEDTKLRRTVALKFLPPHAAEHRERFLREAQSAASLNHPNICTIHEIDDEHHFIAMEWIEGSSVKEKIEARPLPLDEALDIAIQACTGLQAAHEKGIVHRDIKPANLMLAGHGQVKIMDFGLAQVGDRTRLTKSNASMGTPAYMSPEQAQGRPADRRTDIWSIAVVLYEMLAGRVPFPGETEAACTYAIVHTEPEPVTALRSGLPKDLDRILGKALSKDPATRYQNISDLIVDLRSIGSSPVKPFRRKPPPAAVALSVCAVGLAAWYGATRMRLTPTPAAPITRRFEVALGQSVQHPVISPDGRKLAYIDQKQLWIRDLNQLQSRSIPGTAGAARPFWSPDGGTVGFALQNDLWQVQTKGGTPTLIGHLPDRSLGASWSAQGRIAVGVFHNGLFEAFPGGGEPKLLLQAEASKDEFDFHDPHWLPDGNTLLVTAHNRNIGNWRILAVRGAERTVLVSTQEDRLYFPAFASSGYVLFGFDVSSRGTWAVPFDPATLRVTGKQVQVSHDGTGPTISRDGTLAYWRSGGRRPGRVAIVDRGGNILQTSKESRRDLGGLRVSGNGLMVAAAAFENANWDIWVLDLARDTWRRLTFSTAAETAPSWSPDSRSIAFNSPKGIFEVPLAGAASPRQLTSGGRADWGRNNVLVFERMEENRNNHIWYLKPGTAPVAFPAGPATESEPALSPDGRYLAYVSNETRQTEVYIADFPSGQGKRIVSVKGGSRPRWSPRGDELFYIENDSSLMSVRIDSNSGSSAPSKLFDGAARRVDLANYDVMPDGKRFAVVQPDAVGPSSVVVVENWLAEIQP